MTVLKVKYFEKYLEQYLDERHHLFCHQLSGVESNRRDLRLFHRFLTEKGYETISGGVILEFISYLRNDRGNGAGAINRKISSVRSYIKYLRFRQIDGAEELPVEYLGRAREPYSGPIDVLTPEEVKKLLDSIDRQSVLGYRDYVLYTLLYRLGLRIGEALSINLEDVNLEKEVLTIHGKGRRKRILPLISDVGNIIRTWLELRSRLFGSIDQDALFISKKGNRLAIRTAQENFQKLVNQAGQLSLTKVTPHSLRHAFATHAVEGNADLVVLKAVMGHASIHSTQIYLHPSLKSLRKAINDHIASDILHDLIDSGVVIVRTQQQWKKAA